MADDINAATEAEPSGTLDQTAEQQPQPTTSAGQPQTQDQVAQGLPRRGTPSASLFRDNDAFDTHEHTTLLLANRVERCETFLQAQEANVADIHDGLNDSIDFQASLNQKLDTRAQETTALHEQCNALAQETATLRDDNAALTQQVASLHQALATLHHTVRELLDQPADANRVTAQPPAQIDLTGSTRPPRLAPLRSPGAVQKPAVPPPSQQVQALNSEIQALREQLLAARPPAARPVSLDQQRHGRYLQKIEKLQRPNYTHKCMGSQTLLLAEEQFIRYATQLQEDCGASDELIVEQLYKCIPAYMKDEIMEYGTVAYNVNDFVRLFRLYFTPNLSAFYTTFTNQQGDVHLQQAHESVRDFMQKSFYKHLLRTRGVPPPESRVTSSNQTPFWHQFVQKTFQQTHWHEALRVIELLEPTNPDWNSLKTWNEFIQRFRFANARPQAPARPVSSVAEVTTSGLNQDTLGGGMAGALPPAAGPTVHTNMLRVVFSDDKAPPLQFSDFARATSQSNGTDPVQQPSTPSSPTPLDSPAPRHPPPRHTQPPIEETTPEPSSGPAQAAAPCSTPASMPPAPLSVDHALTVAPTSVQTPLPESEQDTVDTAPPTASPAAIPVRSQARQQIPRQADPLVPTEQQRLEQLQRDARAKLAQGEAAQERKETNRRTVLRTENQKQTKPGDKIGSTPLQLNLSDFLHLVYMAAEQGTDVSGAIKVLTSFWSTPPPPNQTRVLSVEQTSIALKALDQDEHLTKVRKEIKEHWEGQAPAQPSKAGNDTKSKRKNQPNSAHTTQSQRPTDEAATAAQSSPTQVPISTPHQQGKEVRITLACLDPNGKMLLAYNKKSEKYGLPSDLATWATDLRPAVNKIISDLGMDNTLPVWNQITVLGTHDAHHGPPRIELGVRTEIPGRHSAKQTHNSRFWVAAEKVIDPPENLRLAHRLSRVVQTFVKTPAPTPAPAEDRKTSGKRHWGNRGIPHYDIRGRPTPWQPGKARRGATPADGSSVVTIDCTSRCGDRDIPPLPTQDTSPPIKVEGLTRPIGPADFQDGTAVVTNGSNTTAVRIVGSDVVIPIDPGHKSNPTPPFAPGQKLRFLVRRGYVTVGSLTRDDFVVAYDAQPVSPVDPYAATTEWRTVPGPDYILPDADIYAQAAKLRTPPTAAQHIVATTAPTHPFWVGPRHRAVRLPISKLDSAAEANCISWEVYTLIRDNLESAGCPLLTSESVSLQGAYGDSRATIFGTVKNVPIFLHENQQEPVFVDFIVMNGSSPVLLGAPFMDEYFQLIHIEHRYFSFYTSPRKVRELHGGDYTDQLMEVPYVIQSRAIVLQSTASVHQVLNINTTHVTDQEIPQDEPDMPELAAEDSDNEEPEEHTEANLSQNLASASLHTPPGHSSPDPDSLPCTQFTPSQEQIADDLQRQVDARRHNTGDMPAGPSSCHETPQPDGLSSRPPKAARQTPPAPDHARRLLFPGPPPATLHGGMATPVTQAEPLPDITTRATTAPPLAGNATRADSTTETIIGRLLANPVLHPFLAAELSDRATHLLVRASYNELIRRREAEHPLLLYQLYQDVRRREVHPIWDNVMIRFLPVLPHRNLDDIDPDSILGGSLEILPYALSLRYLIFGVDDNEWEQMPDLEIQQLIPNFEPRAYMEAIRLFRGELTAAVRAYAPLRDLAFPADSSSDSDYETQPRPFQGTLRANVFASLAHMQFDPIFPSTAAAPQMPNHLETLLPETHEVFRHAYHESAILDVTDPFHLTFPMSVTFMSRHAVRWYREMTFLFQSEPWRSLIAQPRPLPPNTMNIHIRVTAEAALDRMERRRYDYHQTCPAPPQFALQLLAEHDSEGPASYVSGVAYAILSEINTTVLPTFPQFLAYFSQPASFLAGRAAMDSFMGLVVALRSLLHGISQPALTTESGSGVSQSPPRELIQSYPVASRAAQHLLIPLFPRAHHVTWSSHHQWMDRDSDNDHGPYHNEHHPSSLVSSQPARDFFDPLEIVFTAQSVLAHAGAKGPTRFPLYRVCLVIDALTIIDPRFSAQLADPPHEAFNLSPDNQLSAMFDVILRDLHQTNLTRDDLPLVGAVFSTIVNNPHQTVTLGSFAAYLEPNDVVRLTSDATQLANDPAAAVYNTRILLLTASLRSIPPEEYSTRYSQLRIRYSRAQDYAPPAPVGAAAAAPAVNEHNAPQPDHEGPHNSQPQ